MVRSRAASAASGARLTVGILISALFLFLAFRNVDIGQAVAAAREVNYWFLFPATVFLALSYWFRTYRWGVLFRPLKPVRMKNLFSAIVIGYMANNVLPFKTGELLRAYSIGKSENVSKVASFATVVLERVLDGFSLLVILGIALMFQPFPSYVNRAGIIMFAVLFAAILVLTLLATRTEATLGIYRKLSRPLPRNLATKGERMLQSLVTGLLVLKKPRYYVLIGVSTVLIWASYIMTVHMFVYAFGLRSDYHLTVLASMTVLAITGISVSIPSSPGYVGTYHYLAVLSLSIYGVPRSEAFSFAVLFHLFNFGPPTLLGAYYFAKQQLPMHAVREE